jgi:hypothetical protein
VLDHQPRYAAFLTPSPSFPHSSHCSRCVRYRVGATPISARPLNRLPGAEEVDLGDWEYCEADGGAFVMPGVYTYGKLVHDETGA